MKKQYITPETETIRLNVQQPMLTASLGINDEVTSDQFSRELDDFEGPEGLQNLINQLGM